MIRGDYYHSVAAYPRKKEGMPMEGLGTGIATSFEILKEWFALQSMDPSYNFLGSVLQGNNWEQ